MKGLIYRDFYLMRKALILTAAVFVPIIYVEGDIPNRVSRGTEIIIPKASASDVLNDLISLKVTVTGPNEDTVVNEYTPDHEERFTTSLCGTYIVTYIATDSKGNRTIDEYYITSFDEVSPELRFNGSLPKEVSVGSTINLPSYTVIDNDPSTCRVKIYAYSPDGSNSEINNSITFYSKGTYVITYLVTDANNNVKHYVFTVTAK